MSTLQQTIADKFLANLADYLVLVSCRLIF